MAYNFVAASSQYLTTASAPVTGAPITFAATTRNFTSGSEVIISLCRNNGSTELFRMAFLSSAFSIDATDASNFNASSIASTPGNTNACAAVFSSATSRTAYLNGTAATPNTVSSSPASINVIGIGARNNSVSWGQFANGVISEAAIWNVALTDAEITSLSKGFKPSRIRPQSLVFYAPLIRDLQDTKGALAITNNNTATVAVHPRVI